MYAEGISAPRLIDVAPENGYYDSRDNCGAIIRTADNVMIAGCRTSTVPYGVTKIDAGVFKNCRGLRYLSIPETVTEIGYGALNRCTDLTTLIIPASVTEFGVYSLEACSADKLTVYTPAGSAAESYALAHGIKVKDISLAPERERGDVNFDGVTDIRDVTAAQRFLAEYENLTQAQQEAADFNHTSTLTVEDATALQRYLAEFET